jgi:hypothetical protein
MRDEREEKREMGKNPSIYESQILAPTGRNHLIGILGFQMAGN